MAKCINTSHPEFKSLLENSNLDSFDLELNVSNWQELNNTDSFPTVQNVLDLDKNFTTLEIENLLLENNAFHRYKDQGGVQRVFVKAKSNSYAEALNYVNSIKNKYPQLKDTVKLRKANNFGQGGRQIWYANIDNSTQNSQDKNKPGDQLSFFSAELPGLKTIDNKLELEEEISNKVTDRIKQLLRDANIKVESIVSYLDKMREIQPQTDFSGILGVADILNKIIAIENFKELPEEVGHFIVEALGHEHSIIQAMLNNIEFSQLWSEYSSLYLDKYAGDVQKTKIEIVGKYIGRALNELIEDNGLQKGGELTQESRFIRLVRRALEWIKNKLKGISIEEVLESSGFELASQFLAGNVDLNKATSESPYFSLSVDPSKFSSQKILELKDRIRLLKRRSALEQANTLEERIKDLEELIDKKEIENFTYEYMKGSLSDLKQIKEVVDKTKELDLHPRFADMLAFVTNHANIFDELNKLFRQMPNLESKLEEVYSEFAGIFNKAKAALEEADYNKANKFGLTNEFGEYRDNSLSADIRKDISVLQIQMGSTFNLNHPLIKQLATLIRTIKKKVDFYANEVGRELIELQTEFQNKGGKVTDLIDKNSLVTEYRIQDFIESSQENYKQALKVFNEDLELARKELDFIRSIEAKFWTPEVSDKMEKFSTIRNAWKEENIDLSKYETFVINRETFEKSFLSNSYISKVVNLDISYTKYKVGDIRAISVGGYAKRIFVKVLADNKVEIVDSTDLGLANKWKNPNFDKVKNEPYYKALLETLQKEKAKLPISKRIGKYKYMLPQIEQDYMNYLKQGNFKKSFNQWKKEFTTRKDDTIEFGIEGYKDYMLPYHYVEAINPKNLSTDLALSFREFARMSENFKELKEQETLINSVKRQIAKSEFIRKGKKVQGIETNTYAMLTAFLEQHVYDVKSDSIEVKGINVSKTIDKINAWIRNNNLGFNLPTQIAGQLHAEFDTIIEGFVGEYIDKKSQAWAIMETTKNAPEALSDLITRKKVKTNKLVLLLENSGLLSSPEQMFGDSNIQNSMSRLLGSELLYLNYLPGDYQLKSRILLGFMYNTRLINGKWIYKEQYKGEEDFYSFPHMYDKISTKGSKLVYDKELSKDDLVKVVLKADKISARLEGRLSPFEKGKINQNALGRAIMMHRNWLPSGIEYRFKARQVDYLTGQPEEGTYRTVGRLGRDTMQPLWKALISKEQNLIDAWAALPTLGEFEKRQLKRVTADFVIMATTATLAAIMSHLDTDDDDYALNFMIYTSNRLMLEQSAFWSVDTFTELLESPVVGISTIRDTMNIFKMLVDFEELQSGPYEGKIRLQKFIIQRGSPFKNIYELSSLRDKSRYLENMTSAPFFVEYPLDLILED